MMLCILAASGSANHAEEAAITIHDEEEKPLAQSDAFDEFIDDESEYQEKSYSCSKDSPLSTLKLIL